MKGLKLSKSSVSFARFSNCAKLSIVCAPLCISCGNAQQHARTGLPNHFDAMTIEELRAVYEQKDKLASPAILALPDFRRKYTPYTNSCNVWVACVLLQGQKDGSTSQLWQWSHLPTKAEQVYNTTQRDCLNIVWTVFMLRTYFEGTCFTVWVANFFLK